MLMKCGHRAQGALEKTGKPVCVICYPLNPNAIIEEDKMPPLEDRVSKCTCGNTRPSIEWERLAYFEFLPNRDHDIYYCGCCGWD